MFGYIATDGQDGDDALLARLAARLAASGLALVGAVQTDPADAAPRRDMQLTILGSGMVLAISQDLGPLADGCRLDPDGLERAVGLVAASLDRAPAPPDLLIVNKFGRAEAEGRGFRSLIGRALAEGIAVLTRVGPAHRAQFDAFAQGLAERLPADPDRVLAWVGQLEHPAHAR